MKAPLIIAIVLLGVTLLAMWVVDHCLMGDSDDKGGGHA